MGRLEDVSGSLCRMGLQAAGGNCQVLAAYGSANVAWPRGTAWLSMAQHGMAWHNTALHGMAWHNTALHGMAWHNTALHGMAQHSVALHDL